MCEHDLDPFDERLASGMSAHPIKRFHRLLRRQFDQGCRTASGQGRSSDNTPIRDITSDIGVGGRDRRLRRRVRRARRERVHCLLPPRAGGCQRVAAAVLRKSGQPGRRTDNYNSPFGVNSFGPSSPPDGTSSSTQCCSRRGRKTRSSRRTAGRSTATSRSPATQAVAATPPSTSSVSTTPAIRSRRRCCPRSPRASDAHARRVMAPPGGRAVLTACRWQASRPRCRPSGRRRCRCA